MMKTLLSLALSMFFAAPVFGEELRLYAAAGVKSALVKLAAEYEAASGHKIIAVYDTAGATNQKFHALITSPAGRAKLAEEGVRPSAER